MSSFINYTYHHTCKYGQQAYILHTSPFKATKKKAKSGKWRIPFLGEGYYFWEENVEAGVRWGVHHCNNKYCVVEFVDVKLDTSYLLNFLNRRHTNYFNELIDIWIAKRPECKNWALGNWIEFFKKLQKLNEVHFPYKYIRAEENLPDTMQNDLIKRKMYFSQSQGHFIYLSPLLMICVLDKKDLNYQSKSIVKESA